MRFTQQELKETRKRFGELLCKTITELTFLEDNKLFEDRVKTLKKLQTHLKELLIILNKQINEAEVNQI